LVSAEISPGTAQVLGWTESEAKKCAEIPFVFLVEEGHETAADLDLTTPHGACTLRGRLTVGDLIREGYCYLRLEHDKALRVASASVDDGGRFTLHTRSAGTYRLVIHAGAGHYEYKLVTDLVTLEPGNNAWEKTLSEDLWTGEGIRLDAD